MDVFTLNTLVNKLKIEAANSTQLVEHQLKKLKEDITQVKFLCILGLIPKDKMGEIAKAEFQLEDLSIKLNGTIHFLSNPETPALMESVIRSRGLDPEKWIIEALDDPQKLAEMVDFFIQECELLKRR